MIKVLVADDEAIIRAGLESYVNSQVPGMQAVAVSKDGLDALEKASEIKPDIILTDINMPRFDGLQLISKLKEIKDYSPEFIILTGFGEFEYAKTALELGVSAFLLKPINMEDLSECLKKAEEKIIKKRKLTEQLSDYYSKIPYFQNLFLINLFTGKIHDRDAIQKQFRQYQIVPKKYFALAALNTEISESLISSHFTPPTGSVCYFIPIGSREYCFLIFQDHENSEELYSCLEKLSADIHAFTDTNIYAGISNFYSGEKFYSIAYYEALDALNLTNEHSSILFYTAVGQNGASSLVQNAINIIARDYSRQITINEVAAELMISPSHIMHLFKQETGKTFVQFLTDYRIEIAIKMLKSQNYKIYEVADRVGYKDTKHFTKIFKKETGHSPSYYIK